MQILEIELATNNIDKTETFYTEILGLKPKSKSQDSISFSTGESILTFVKSDVKNPTYHFAFNIPCNKLEDAISWTSARLGLIKIKENEVVADFKTWNAKSIYFCDNNGNILEFIARFNLENKSEKPFDINSIESISEIGIVTENPQEFAEKLITEKHLSHFKNGAESEKFSILGDDNGLLIIVKTNRNWYPTEHPAKRFYTKIKIKSNGIISGIIINAD